MDQLKEEWGQLNWSVWVDLLPGGRYLDKSVTSDAGFYRIRSGSKDGLVYIGQTGRSLRGRIQDLSRGIKRPLDDPPWNDPHTAAPILWAYRIEDQLHYEVSVANADRTKKARECHEDYLLYLHRLQFGFSTLINHGRLHPLWSRASNRRDGRPTKRSESARLYTSLKPATGNLDPMANDWLGLKWSNFESLSHVSVGDIPGVYRIQDLDNVVYVGQSAKLRDRINQHRQNRVFSDTKISYHLMPEAESHQLKEREVDLIGAFYKLMGEAPNFQYQGK